MSLLFFQAEQLSEFVAQHYQIGSRACSVLDRFLRVKQHAGAQTHTAVVALKYVVIDTTLASLPEFLVISQLGNRHRFVAHARI